MTGFDAAGRDGTAADIAALREFASWLGWFPGCEYDRIWRQVPGTGPVRLRQLGWVEIGVKFELWRIEWGGAEEQRGETGVPGVAARLSRRGLDALAWAAEEDRVKATRGEAVDE